MPALPDGWRAVHFLKVKLKLQKPQPLRVLSYVCFQYGALAPKSRKVFVCSVGPDGGMPFFKFGFSPEASFCNFA
eukprot:8138605-Pyramimonas_sp.AAC.1